MRRGLVAKMAVATVAPLAAAGGIAYAAGTFHAVSPHSFDPAHTFLVSSGWINGIGCPTDAKTSSDGAHLDGHARDAGCPTGDPRDPHNQGLLLNKSGPSANYAAAQAELKDVGGIQLKNLGYDIRKPGGDRSDPRGSHCGAGAPRFDIVYSDGTDVTTGCNSVNDAQVTDVGEGWMRIRFTPPSGHENATVKKIFILSDEGTDAGPDHFGLSVLDNIDVNGVIVGHGDKGDTS